MLVRISGFIFVLTLLSGCATLSYYSHIMNGHLDLMSGQQPINEIISNKDTSQALQEKLKRVLEIRKFAVTELGLPDNDSYTHFVKLDRPYPVWNVVAAEKFSVEPKKWCFLIVGCISYRGYFNEQQANEKAEELKAAGYDVYVSGAAAYSTLGWFDDPVLSSMLYNEEAHLAGIIFHELAHQLIYIDDDSAFNEAFATALELEGVRRWLQKQGDAESIKRYRTYKNRQADFNQLLRSTQTKLKTLYAEKHDQKTMSDKKQGIIKSMHVDYQQLKQKWQGYKGYDRWMSKEINNARLALVATYYDLVPAFERMLQKQNFVLESFYQEVRKIGELEKKIRNNQLHAALGREL